MLIILSRKLFLEKPDKFIFMQNYVKTTDCKLKIFVK